MKPRLVRRLTLALATLYAALGTLEVVGAASGSLASAWTLVLPVLAIVVVVVNVQATSRGEGEPQRP